MNKQVHLGYLFQMRFEKIAKEVAIWTAQKTYVDGSWEEQNLKLYKQSKELLLHDGVE